MSATAQHWIDGQWLTASASSPIFNPANGTTVGGHAWGEVADADAAIEAAQQAFRANHWSRRPRLRAQVMLEFADRMEARAEEIALNITRGNGVILAITRREVAAAISEVRYYAGLARNIFGRTVESDAGVFSVLSREPAGVAGIIVPWNAPAILLIRSLAPAMAAGCTSVIKPAPQTALGTHSIMACLAGIESLPPGVVNCVYETGDAVARHLVASPAVDVLNFTGSSAVGKAIMRSAADTLKRVTLELGGKAPCVVYDDCNIAQVAARLAASATVMSGQHCTAASRVLVQESIYAPLREALTKALADLRVGPGESADSNMGPIIDMTNRDRILQVVANAAKHGEIVLQGVIPEGELAAGSFLTPSLIVTDDINAEIVQEEVFGPVLTLEQFSDEAAAIDRANHTRYGLGASVWTQNLGRAQRTARGIRSGTVWINTHVALIAECETGGFGESGLGRLHGVQGLEEFLETKHVYYEAGLTPSRGE